jgi:hypothetical protein
VVKAFDIIPESELGFGFELNITKTNIFWPSRDGNKHCGELFPSDIGRSALGVKLLEGSASGYRGFVEGLAMKRVIQVVELIHLLPQLRDPQSEFILLRPCMGIIKPFFGQKTCQPIHMEEASMLFDKELQRGG